MLNVFDVSDALVEHIKSNYPDDIAVIAYYGSYAQGSATKRSDLDFFFIPTSAKGYRASIQFIIEDISFDFWPIGWERAERMASFDEPNTTIIADCKLLYVRSDEDHKRFMKLRDNTTSLQGNRWQLMGKAETELGKVYGHLYKLIRTGESENITLFRTEAHGVLTKVLQSLALLNQTYFTKGFGKNQEQIQNLPLKPTRLESYMHTIMQSSMTNEILQACEQLVADTLDLLLAAKEKQFSTSYPDRMKGFYEEVKGVLDKIITACERNDYGTAFFNTIHMQDEISRFLYFAETGYAPCKWMSHLDYQGIYKLAGLPEVVALLQFNDLSQLQAAVERLSSDLESHLRTKGVEINRFHSLEQFKGFLIGK